MPVDHENIAHINRDALHDSAGRPWQGRAFEANGWADDDGSAPEILISAVRAFRAGEVSAAAVVDAFRQSRVLIPLLAELGEAEVGEHGQLVDKSADLSIVTVAGPDGQTVLPVFSSVSAMQAWNPKARPVPTEPMKAALAAAAENTHRIVIDPGSEETEFVLRRPAIEAVARGLTWASPEERADVHEIFTKAIAGEPEIFAFALMSGDPQSRLAGSELLALFRVRTGLSEEQLNATMNRVFERLTQDEVFAASVDSMAVKLVAAEN
ncbi:MAG: SseB family protein [Actinomycetales bacterium]|nr:SseB family protein [Actinomycetales bacterium]